jgi:hypothetical protein
MRPIKLIVTFFAGVLALALATVPLRADDAADYSKHISAAQAALKAGQIDEAAKEVDLAVALSPSRYEGFLLRFSILTKRNDAKGAEAALVEAQKFAPPGKRKGIANLEAGTRAQAGGRAGGDRAGRQDGHFRPGPVGAGRDAANR